MLSYCLKMINTELHKYDECDRQALLKTCINNKLAYTLKRYNEDIDANSEYLLTRSSFKVLKALTKLQKKEDVKAIKETLKLDTEEDINE